MTTVLATGYDTWGRVVSYTDSIGTTATTGYDLAGRPVRVDDGKGVTGYTYDSVGEYRGLVTP